MSTTRVWTVSAARAATIRAFACSWVNDSVAAEKRVPIITPWAPSISAAANPRPSAMPPAARTGTGATASTTAGTRGSVEREEDGSRVVAQREVDHLFGDIPGNKAYTPGPLG